MNISFDIYQTLGLAAVSLLLGKWLRRRVSFFERFCIPAPVIGGLVFSLLTLALHGLCDVHVTFDDTLKNVCMVLFFTSVGFQADLQVLRQGGRPLLCLLVLVLCLIVLQNAVAIGVGSLVGLDALTSLTSGSIPMIGGHGTAGAFGPLLEQCGVYGATSIATAAATFGLVGGSIIGGPIAEHLIRRHRLQTQATDPGASDRPLAEAKAESTPSAPFSRAVFIMVIASALGTLVSKALDATGLSFPIYIGGMLVAAVWRNVGSNYRPLQVPMQQVNDFGGICLSLFLGIAMVTLRLWELSDLALPLLAMLTCQLVLMALYARFVVFRVMGRNYDAAVLTAGTCGFGMGATPNAMANMQAVCSRYSYSVQAFLLIPIVGSMFVDFINSFSVTLLINMLK